MKKILLSIAVCLMVGASAQAQGIFNLANGAPGLDAPITDASGALITSSSFWVQAYTAAGAGAAEGSLTALGSPFRVDPADPGYFYEGNTAVPGSAGGSTVSLQIRAWSGNAASYEAASLVVGTQVGKGNIVNVALVTPGGVAFPNNPNGLNAFQLTTVVPEPSVIMLGLAGAGLLWFRRKK